MYYVTVFADTVSDYVSQIYAGLYELSALRQVKFKLSKTASVPKSNSDYAPYTLLMDVVDSKSQKHRSIFFDMTDGHRTLLMDDLNNVDIYIKRTFDESFIQTLSSELRKKIIPYGLHYCCRSQLESPMMFTRRLFLYNRIQKLFYNKPLKALWLTFGRPLRIYFLGSLLPSIASVQPFPAKDYEVPPSEPAERKIYFRTRVYDVADAPSTYSCEQRRKVNQVRVETIRVLKAHFGENFVGGLRASSFAKKHYPDCLDEKYISPAQHIEYCKRYLININTDGLHGSIGWKFPEYLAASRCIVSEPVSVKLPVAIEAGKHYLAFRTPDECIQACEALMNNKSLAMSMRHNNHIYYRENLTPSKLIYNCLEKAFSN